MSKISFNTILVKAKNIKKSVEKEYKLGESSIWGYYIAKAILSPKRIAFDKVNVSSAPNPRGDYVSRQMYYSDFMKSANYVATFVEKNKRMPNFIEWKDKKLKPSVYIDMFARILVYYAEHNHYPKMANVNSKAFTKPSEPTNEVLEYFEAIFGKVTCFDDALDYISGRGYSYYYDDRYSNKETIDRIRAGLGVNCTDVTHVLTNIGRGLIERDNKYKSVDAVHVLCSGGDGHIRSAITMHDGSKFYRDGACTLSNGGYCNWCISNYTLLGTNPSWFTANLNR